jgi:hypothetical protein
MSADLSGARTVLFHPFPRCPVAIWVANYRPYWAMPDRPTKISFGAMRDSGLQRASRSNESGNKSLLLIMSALSLHVPVARGLRIRVENVFSWGGL